MVVPNTADRYKVIPCTAKDHSGASPAQVRRLSVGKRFPPHLERTPVTYVTGISNVVTITRYSTINKLLAVIANVLRFIHNLSKHTLE